MRQRLLSALASPRFITFVALLLRAFFVFYKSHEIPANVLATIPFQNEAANVASSLAEGHGFCCLFRQPTGPTAWVAPVYPLLLAAIFKRFGIFTLDSFYVAVLLNCVFSALVCLPVFAASKRVGGSGLAAPACWLWAIFPSGIILPFEWIWDTSLSALLAALLLWITIELPNVPRTRNFAIYGLLWALALLTNPTLGALLPFLLGWVLYRHDAPLPQKVRMACLTLGVILFACAPWTARNYLLFHRFIPFRSNFPYEFWSGNNELFDEHSRAVNRITHFEQTHLYATLGENGFLDDKRQKSTQFVRFHPGLYAQLFARRVVATWLGSPSPWHDFVKTDSRLAKFLLLWNAGMLFGVVFGLARFRHRARYLLPLAAFPVVFPIIFYIAHTSLRHRHPCDPALVILLAAAIAGVNTARGVGAPATGPASTRNRAD